MFHDITDRAARHTIGSATSRDRNRIRRSWSHGEIASLAEIVLARAKAVAANPHAPPTKDVARWGPLVDLAAGDADIVVSLRLFSALQEQRHRADYDHEASFDKLTLLDAHRDAERARASLAGASAVGREALLALLVAQRGDFRERSGTP
ncbi:MAG TPA: hypothetical protein VF640_01005 [Acidimicrobiales bacterium]